MLIHTSHVTGVLGWAECKAYSGVTLNDILKYVTVKSILPSKLIVVKIKRGKGKKVYCIFLKCYLIVVTIEKSSIYKVIFFFFLHP